jgi:hypothetical protein
MIEVDLIGDIRRADFEERVPIKEIVLRNDSPNTHHEIENNGWF